MSVIAGVLPRMRSLSEGEMLDAVTIHTPGGGTFNEYGAQVAGAASDVATVGRVSPLDANDLEAARAGELRIEGLERLTLPLETPVTGAATVTVVSARHGTSKTYDVEGVVPLSTFSVHQKVLMRSK